MNLITLLEYLLGENWLGVLSTTGMLVFIAIFLGVVVWIVTRSRRQIDRWSKLPLEDDQNEKGETYEKDQPDKS